MVYAGKNRIREANTRELKDVLSLIGSSSDWNWDAESSSFKSRKKDIYVSFYDAEGNSTCVDLWGEIDLSFVPTQVNIDIVGLKGGYSSLALKEAGHSFYIGNGKLTIFSRNGDIAEYLLW